MKTIFQLDTWNKQDYKDYFSDFAFGELCDDATYPQRYLERLAKQNKQVLTDFADDIVTDSLSDEMIAEAEQHKIDFTRSDIWEQAYSVIKQAWDEWEQMPYDERKYYYDDEI